MKKNEFNLLYAIKKNGMGSVRDLSKLSGASTGFISKCLQAFREDGLVDDNGITKAGMKALKPYKVENAVIMAAGLSSRFVPLSLEKPKGLLIVKNEVLIERQIEQLHEAGIKKIVLVLGNKKESFFYLEDKYDDITIVINPEYNTRNNTYTLFLAREYIGNTYICSSDDYFTENPFDEYVYQSYYAAIHTEEPTDEYYMFPDSKGNIKKVEIGGGVGDIMLGHVYWDKAFSKAMLKIIVDDQKVGKYRDALWEIILKDNVKSLPPMEIKLYPPDDIFEFDSLDELREFDLYYVNNTHSKIIKNIAKYFGCQESDILHFQKIKIGLTNTTFSFEYKGKKYVYRHSAENKDKIISRVNEKKALEIAKKEKLDPTFLFMNEKEGYKISDYVPNTRTPDYESAEDNKKIIKVLRRLHDANVKVDWEVNPWKEAAKFEKLAKASSDIDFKGFDELKKQIKSLYDSCEKDGVEARLCHCDTYKDNWMIDEKGKAILIDWEYAGMADPGCDIGAYIMDTMWEVDKAEKFIKQYLGKEYNEKLRVHFLSYVAIISYQWFVWALYKESCGAVMGESLHNWYVMAKRYAKYILG